MVRHQRHRRTLANPIQKWLLVEFDPGETDLTNCDYLIVWRSNAGTTLRACEARITPLGWLSCYSRSDAQRGARDGGNAQASLQSRAADVVGYSRLAGAGRRSDPGASAGAARAVLTDQCAVRWASWAHRQAHRRRQLSSSSAASSTGVLRARSKLRPVSSSAIRACRPSGALSSVSAFISATWSRKATAI